MPRWRAIGAGPLMCVLRRDETTSVTSSFGWNSLLARSSSSVDEMHHYRNLLYWMIPLAVPTAVQVAFLRANWFRSEWMPLLFTTLCFLYLLAWRHCFRSAYRPRGELRGVPQANHLMIARFAIAAVVGAAFLSAAFLGFSVLTGSGPYNQPVIWLLFFVWLVSYIDIIMAVAMIAIRQNAAATPPTTTGSEAGIDP
jgi:hypothetical protein